MKMVRVDDTLLGQAWRFEAAPGLFSPDRVDDGTRLLLDHLPASPPSHVLDMGCGYGALGLPVARAFPNARCTLVDRDLLAVECARHNANAAGLSNVHAMGSLGYRDITQGPFDWVLCNVPARIGRQGVGYLMAEGASRLTPQGVLMVVVIRDLAPVVVSLKDTLSWIGLSHVASGARHDVFSLPSMNAPGHEHENLYVLDTVAYAMDGQNRSLVRPHDINEDPGHLKAGMPLLLECLPRAPGRCLVVRGGYGAAAVLLALRGGQVTAVDRDLMGTTYTRRNAAFCQVEVRTQDTVWPARALEGERFDLVTGELHSQEDPSLWLENLTATLELLAPGGQALWLVREKQKKLLPPTAVTLAQRGDYAVVRLGPPPPGTKRGR